MTLTLITIGFAWLLLLTVLYIVKDRELAELGAQVRTLNRGRIMDDLTIENKIAETIKKIEKVRFPGSVICTDHGYQPNTDHCGLCDDIHKVTKGD